MLGREFRPIYEDALRLKKNAEESASAINRLDDLKKHHLYVGFVAFLNDPVALDAYKNTPDWAPIVDEKWGALIEGRAKEVESLVKGWLAAEGWAVSPSTEDRELQREEGAAGPTGPALPPPPTRSWTWGWILLGIAAVGGGVALASKSWRK